MAVLWICTAIVSAQLQQIVAPNPPAAKTPTTNPHDITDSEFRFVLAPHIVPATTPSQMELCGRWLNLSNEQVVFVKFLYEQYRQRYGASLKAKLGLLSELSQSAGASVLASTFDYGNAHEYERFITVETALNDELLDAEAQFFSELEPALSNEQGELLWRARALRNRVVAMRFNFTIDVQAARFDLWAFAEELYMDPESRGICDAVLVSYEREVTPLFEQLSREIKGRLVRLQYLQADLRFDPTGRRLDYKVAADRQRAIDTQATIRTILAEGVRWQKAIAKLNVEYALKLSEQLPPPTSSAFFKAFQERAYPRVYPDEASPAELLEQIVNRKDLSEDIHQSIAASVDQWQQQYTRICEQMEQRYQKWCEKQAETQGMIHDEFVEYTKDMRTWRERRWQKSEECVKRVCSLLPPDTAAAMKPRIDDFQRTLKSLRAEAQQDKYPPVN
jgi:hypothetical protein